MAFVVRLKARFRHGERRPRSDRPLTAPQTRVRRSHSGFGRRSGVAHTHRPRRAWGMDVAKRRGSKRAKVALARKIGIILHRMWIDGTTYRWAEAKPIAAQA
jgi:hypothetical protein